MLCSIERLLSWQLQREMLYDMMYDVYFAGCVDSRNRKALRVAKNDAKM